MTPLRKRLIGELKLRGLSDRTIESYVGQVYRLAKYHAASPDALSLEQIREYLRYLTLERKLAPNSVNVAFNAIVFLYRDVLGWDVEGKLENIKRPKIRQKLPRFYSQEDVYRIIRYGCVGRARSELFVMGVYAAGLRIGEACSLKWRDVEWGRGMLRVDGGKGGKDRYLPLSPIWAERLRPHWEAGDREPGRPIFAARGESPDIPIAANTARRWYDQAVERCGVARQGSVHCLRHSYATHQLERGVDINALRVLMGHQNVQTTMIYLHVAKSRIEKAGTPLEDICEEFGEKGKDS